MTLWTCSPWAWPGALSDDEYRTLEDLLATDPDLANEYAALQEASTATLAEAASEAPPMALRASILEAIRDVEQLPPTQIATDGATELVAEAPVRPVPAADQTTHHEPSNVVPIHHRRWMIPATAAAAVVMLLVGGLLFNRFADAPSDDRMAAVLDDDSAVTIPLSGDLEGLELIASEREGASVLMGTAVDPPDEGMVFQLWAVHDDEKVDMGTFTPAASGDVEVFVDGTDVDYEYAITIEPAGGSEQPTSDPVAVSPGLA